MARAWCETAVMMGDFGSHHSSQRAENHVATAAKAPASLVLPSSVLEPWLRARAVPSAPFADAAEVPAEMQGAMVLLGQLQFISLCKTEH